MNKDQIHRESADYNRVLFERLFSCRQLSQWFEITPLPGNFWRVTVKRENVNKLSEKLFKK